MLFKTMCLQMIQDHPEMYDQLLSNRQLLPTLEMYARDLKTRHEMLKEQLSQANPASGESQIASAALEIAMQEMQNRLLCEFPPDDPETLSLDGAMAYVRHHTPPA